ncbi:hypothetical protein AGMMS50284_4620 [Clostridia bacterium]|nr:hypothetical protein AGMMS50284_4620 [Clostridia bacterium]
MKFWKIKKAWKMTNKTNMLNVVGGTVTGVLNGLLGAGGGMVAVPILKKEMEARQAHANSVCIILPICIVSAINYILSGKVQIGHAMPYMGWGVLGAVFGTVLLQKINQKVLRKMFALLMLWAGYRLVFR